MPIPASPPPAPPPTGTAGVGSHGGIERSAPRVLAGLLMLLGLTVLAGWLGQWPALTHVIPGMTGMVMQTAFDFVLVGLALLMPRHRDVGRVAVLLPSALLVLIAMLNLVQIGSGLELGINLRSQHEWIVDDNPRPGQQALPTSLSFLIAGLSLLAFIGLPTVSRPAISAGRTSAVLLFLIALAALAGYALRIELLVNWYAFSKMALHTAIGLVLVAAALWWRWDGLESRDGAEARELRGLVLMSLVLTALVASVTAVAVFRNEGERALDSSLAIARSSMVEGVGTVLTLRSTRAAIITTRPILLAGVRRLALNPSDRDALNDVRRHIDGFLGYGFSWIALLDAGGQPLVEVGTDTLETGLQLPLKGLPGGAAALQADQGFLLRHRSLVDAGDGVQAILVTEQRLPELMAILSTERWLGQSARSLLCGTGPAAGCASADGEPMPGIAVPPSLDADQTEPTDPHAGLSAGDRRLSSWQRLGGNGLVLNLSLDSEDLYAPIRRGLYWGFLLVALFTGLAALLLRSRVATLVARLARSESRYGAVFEAVSDGLMLVDRDGQVLAINGAAGRILGMAPEALLGRRVADVDWQALDEQGQPIAVADYPATRVLAGDGQPLTQVVSIARPDGQRRWLRVDASLAPGLVDHVQVCAVMAFADITERRRDEHRLAESQRFQRALLDAAPYAVIASDTAFNCIEFNPAAERMLCYRAGEMVGKVVPPMIHDPQEVMARAAELSRELGRPVAPGPDVFVLKAHDNIVEEREWTYIRKDGSRFPVNLAVTAMRDEQGEPTGYLGIAYDITERKRREEYTQHVAHHDFLTGLPNRMLLNDRLAVALEGARRHRSRLAVMMLDLDHFKRINDSLGHHIGDLLLVEVAKRLQQTVRASDTVARLGGDEFVMLLPEPGDEPGAIERLAQKIVAAVGAPMNLHGHELEVTPSLGVAVFPDDGTHADTLMKNADTALYRAKALGRNAYRMFSSDMAKVVDDRLTLEAAMRQALKRREFRLHYQPQVDLDSGAVIGMEALLRWTDPQLGSVSPATFIPVAEECGLILQLGEWVLRTATREAVEIQQRSGQALRLAVNLSARQFRQNDLVEMVADALAVSGLPAAQLELEITEGALMVDTDETQARLKALRALGVSIAIDDFGVGFSSLSYVTRFDIDTLKIDRSFIAALPDSASDAAVARTVIALGQALGIKVVAEGVENDAQLAFLRGHRCDLGQGARFGMAVELSSFSVQGFHFAAALSPDDFVAVLPRLSAIRA